MKFYIEVIHPELGKINSEIYSGTDEDFKNIIDNVLKERMTTLDFYNEDGDFLVIQENVLRNSIVYFKRK